MYSKNRQKHKLPKIRLCKRQEIWILTAQGWVMAIAVVVAAIFFTISNIHPFLAVNSPIKSAELLVVEGWLPDYAIAEALTEFKRGSYRQIVTTGSPLDKGTYLTEYKNSAEVSAATLTKLGLVPEKLVVVASPLVMKDRSYVSAVSFRQWLTNSNLKISAINLLSLDVHTRRSWLLFNKVLSPEIKVGAIAAKTLDYNPSQWWVASEGVRTILDEAIAYIYAQFFNWQA